MYDTHWEHVYLCFYTHHIQVREGDNRDKIWHLFNHRTSGLHCHSVVFTVTCWELSWVECILLPLGSQAQERFSGAACELLEAARLQCRFLCAALGLQSQVNEWPRKWDLWPAVTKHTKTLSPSVSLQQVTGTAKRCLQCPKDREIEPVCDFPSQCILSVSDMQNYAFVSALMAVNPFYIKHIFMAGGILSG